MGNTARLACGRINYPEASTFLIYFVDNSIILIVFPLLFVIGIGIDAEYGDLAAVGGPRRIAQSSLEVTVFLCFSTIDRNDVEAVIAVVFPLRQEEQ